MKYSQLNPKSIMKKLMAIAVLSAFTGTVVMAQTPELKEKFRKDNPDAMNTVWKSEKDNTYRVSYSENKTEYATVYDKDGNVLMRQTVIKDKSIPTGINDYYTKRATGTNDYSPSYTVWQSTDKNGNVNYYGDYKGKQTWFDKDGNVITRSGMAEGEMEKQDDKMPIDK
jgi:hypothetical protein